MFSTVLWKGIRQALGWFFGLFGYKRKGGFAHCVWGLFALSATIIVTIVAGALLYSLGNDFYRSHHYIFCDGKNCYWHTYISRDVYLHDHGNGNAELINTRTGETTLKGISWIAKPLGEKDSLVVFSDGKKRGYLNMYTGEVVIPAKYSRAWVFSGGIASVEENGVIKFINSEGEQVFDRVFCFNPDLDGYVFHGGYCVIDDNADDKYGLMNTKGEIVVPEEYDKIKISESLDYWTMTKGNFAGLFDKNLTPVLPMMECSSMWICNDEIEVTMLDNTMRKYDIQGNLIDDFYINDFKYLEYETEETYQTKVTYSDDDGIEHECQSEPQHKTARARLCMYEAGHNRRGLMTADGHVVTLPKYKYITAVGPDVYLCEVENGDKEIVNGKGQKVR